MTTTAPNQGGTLAIDLIGNTPLVRLPKVTADLPAGVTVAGEGRVAQSGRQRQGSARALDDPRRDRARAPDPGEDDPGGDERQHRDRAGDDRRGARLPGRTLPAGERQPRAEAHPARLRRRRSC